MTDLAKLVVKLEAQTAKYQADLEKANKKLDRFAQRSNTAARVAGTALKVGVLAGAAAMVTLAARAVTAGDRLDKLSTRLGDSVENLSRFEFAAERTGVKTTTLNTGLQRLVRRVDEVAKTGKGEAKVALDELGLSAQKLGRLAPTEQMLVLADAFEGVEDQSTRVRLAMKLFDTEGVALIQTLDGGQEALRGLLEESDRLGNTLSTQTAKDAAEFKDRLTDLKAAASGVGNAIITATLPAINDLSRAFLDAQPAISGYIKFYSEALQRTERFVASGRINQIKDNLADLRGELEKLGDPRRGVDLIDVIRLGGRSAAVEAKQKEIEQLRNLIRFEEEKLKAELEDFNDLVFGPPAAAVSNSAPAKPAVSRLNLSDFAGKNSGPPETDAQKSKTAERFAEETAQIVSLNQERFKRLREERLRAEGFNTQIETERFQRELQQITEQEELLRTRLGDRFNLEAEFNQSREDAAIAHQKRLTDIEQEGADARREVQQAQLAAVGAFFGALGTLAKEGSKANRVLLAAEKGAALAQAIISLQVAIAKANSLGFPANIPAIAQAVSIGAGAISSIRAVNIDGARADGGPVRSGGTYLVGERGPELFTPSAAGSIVPNESLGGLTVNLVEDSSRAGQVSRNGNELQIIVDTIRGELSRDVAQGRGFAEVMQSTYPGLRRGARS